MARPKKDVCEPRWKKPWADGTTGKEKGGFWYVFHGGKRHSLTKYGAPTTKVRGIALARNARDRFLAEMREAEQKGVDIARLQDAKQQEARRGVILVRDVINFYLTKHRRLAASSRPEAERILTNFATGKDGGKNGIKSYRGFGKLRWDQVTHKNMDDWVAAHPKWTELSSVEIVQRAFNFAVRHRRKTRVNYNPFRDWQPRDEDVERFAKQGSKAYFHTPEEVEAFREHSGPQFRVFFDANLQLGTRPGEIAKLTTDHVRGLDSEHVFWQLNWHEWKSGRKTQKQRVIQLTPTWEEFTRHRMAEVEAGERLFFNDRTRPWTNTGWVQAFRKTKHRTIAAGKKIDSGLTMMSTRHTFVTRALTLDNKKSTSYKTKTKCGQLRSGGCNLAIR